MVSNFPCTTKDVTIASGGSLSGFTYIGHGKLVSIQMPAAWTAAGLTFQGSFDGSTFNNIFDSTGTEVTAAADASELVTIDKFEGALWIKVRSGTSGSPVVQGADRTLTLLVQKFPIPSFR